MNKSITVRSEDRAIYTLSRNLTVQIYVGSSDVDLGTSDLNRKHCSHRVRSPHEQVNVETPNKHRDFRWSRLPTYVETSDMRSQSTSKAPGVGTPGKVWDFQRSEVPTYVGTSDGRNQPASRTTGVGTPDLGRDFRLSGVSTHIRTSDVHSHRVG